MDVAIDVKQQIIEGLKEVFGDADNPAQMKILVRRIPIICTNIETMHESIKEIKDHVFQIDSKLNGEMIKYHKVLEEKMQPITDELNQVKLDRVENNLVKKLMFGLVGLVLVIVAGAVIALVIQK